eukprot:2486504-Alexandrium_andersonii.AAC.1
MSACQLQQEDLLRLAALLQRPRFTGKKVAQLRGSATDAPPPLPKAEVDALSAYPVYRQEAPVARPSWVSPICWNRETFHRAAFCFQQGLGEPVWAKFLFATQSP